MRQFPLFFITLSCLVGCSQPTPDATPPDSGRLADMPVVTDAGMDARADLVQTPDASAMEMGAQADADMAPLPDMPEEPLRPNVQEGKAPNATDQEPAFPAQTRAPQPARDTAVSREVLATGLQIPWGIAPLPDGRLLVTERPGRLRLVSTDGTLSDPLSGVPESAANGQGGLLDVTISPSFGSDRLVFLSFSESRGNQNTAVTIARARLATDDASLEDLTILHRQEPARRETRHYGSRIVFDPSGALFATFGDRGGSFEDAQSPFNSIGAVIRILPDGSIPQDNPFVDGVEGDPAVWSWGHRNIQSATIGPDGALWTVEHGARGGDELNRPVSGANHGWPIISYGIDYDGGPIGEGITQREGLAQPVYYWDPVIAPSGMATYTGDLFAGWQGDLLIGGLQAEAVVRLKLREGQVYTEEWIPMGTRVRSLAIANDGAVLVGTDDGEIVALRPD